jgi:hypothetical protein
MLKVGDDHFVALKLLGFVRSRRDRVVMMFSRPAAFALAQEQDVPNSNSRVIISALCSC